jgi:hypothetical protein
LNLTLAGGGTTGAIACYYGGTTRLTTHYPAGSVILLTYRVNGLINGVAYTGWWAHAQYYTNDPNYYQRYSGSIKALSAIVAGNVIVGTASGYFHLKTGSAFDITLPIMYAGSAISAGYTGNNNYPGFNFTITTTQSITLTSYKPVYIKGNLSGKMFTPVSTTPITQIEPTSDDGYEYVLLGYASSTTALQLIVHNPVLRYRNGDFRVYAGNSITVGTNAPVSPSANDIWIRL